MAKRKSSQNPRWGKAPWKVAFRPKRRSLPDEVDFVVVGGGFTGLSAAAYLRKLAPERPVLLLEGGWLGNGASGRTGGIALDDTAAGKLPGLGNVLAAYRKILCDLRVHADLSLPGVWELGRGGAAPSLEAHGTKLSFRKHSPISWNDSGNLRIVRKVPGGTVDPGKVVSGLARAAEASGARIIEHAEVREIEFADPLRLRVDLRRDGRIEKKWVRASRVLLATNAGALELAGIPRSAEPKLTFAVATAPLTRAQIAALGLADGHPFYTVDLPYLWGRLFGGNRVIFGSGLVPAFGNSLRPKPLRAERHRLWHGLERFDARKGESEERLRSLEQRVRRLHPVLKSVRITHRWGGPILITRNWLPVFRRHPKSPNVLVLGGFSGHGVALSVYLGRWAAEILLGKRALPRWTEGRDARF
jgi:glycine/D-amino acid oxidase-like deaminating enzyme